MNWYLVEDLHTRRSTTTKKLSTRGVFTGLELKATISLSHQEIAGLHKNQQGNRKESPFPGLWKIDNEKVWELGLGEE